MQLSICLSSKEIRERVKVIAHKISSDYNNSELVIIGVLKGALIFFADLVRSITIPVKFDFICVSSYGDKNFSSGMIKLIKPVEIDIRNKAVIIVEDIIDTGYTMTFIIDYLNTFNPKSIKVCSLLDKKERRAKEIEPDYICFNIDKGFLVGYGLDYNEDYRALKDIYYLNN